jgi:hypothetical protein
MRRTRISVVLLLGIMMVLGFTSCGISENSDELGDKLSVPSHNMIIGEHGGVVIEGIVRNGSNTRCNYGVINFKIYDSDGQLIDTYSDVFSDLEPGGTWAFEIRPDLKGREAASYHLARVRCLA